MAINYSDPYRPTANTPAENPNLGSVITSDALNPQKPVEYKTMPQIPLPDVSKLDASFPQMTMTQPEQQASDLTTKIQDLNKSLIGESAYRTQQEDVQGVADKTKTYNDLSAKLKGLQNEALAIPLQIQQDATGRGVTAGGVAPIQTAKLRENAIASLSTSSLLEAAKGNLTTAMTLADRAVAAKFDPIKEEIATAKANLDLVKNSPEYSIAEKNRATQQQLALDRRNRIIARQEADAKEINTTLQTAIKYGLTDSTLMQKISQATSPLEAQQLAAKYLQDPKAKFELESARLDNILKIAQINKTNKETAQIGQPTAEEKKTAAAAKVAAQEAIPAAMDKLALINKLMSSSGLNSAVGPTPLGRISILSRFGSEQDFIAGVQQLVSQDTLNTLLNLKKGGGTLGALSDQERIMLQSAASKIGTWAMKDASGNVTGYNVDEKSFKDELTRIQTLTNRALQKAQEGVLSTDEDKVLDEMFKQDANTTDSSFSPDQYFTP